MLVQPWLPARRRMDALLGAARAGRLPPSTVRHNAVNVLNSAGPRPAAYKAGRFDRPAFLLVAPSYAGTTLWWSQCEVLGPTTGANQGPRNTLQPRAAQNQDTP